MSDSEFRKMKVLPLPTELQQLMNISGNCPFLVLPGQEGQSGFDEMLFSFAQENMLPKDAERLKQEWSVEALLAAEGSGKKSARFEFHTSDGEQRRLVLRFMTDEDSEQILGVLTLYACEDQGQLPEMTGGFPISILAMPYASFAVFQCTGENTVKRYIIKDELSILPRVETSSWQEYVKCCCDRFVLENWKEEYLKKFLPDAETGQVYTDNRLLTESFFTESGRVRQDLFLLPGKEGMTCCIGLMREETPKGLALTVSESDKEHQEQAVANAYAEMQMEMQFERKEMKSHTRRLAISLTTLALLGGLIGGALLDRRGGFFTNILNQFMPKETEEEVQEEETVSTAEVVEEEEETVVEKVYVSRLETAEFISEISENGTPRTNTSQSDYSTGSFTAHITNVEGPDYFETNYSDYTLDGTEASIEFEMSFAQNEDEDLTIAPQDAFYMSVVGYDGEVGEDYQLMDQIFGGNYDVKLSDGETKALFKRYLYDDAMHYLVISAYEDGKRTDYYLAIRYDDKNVTHETLQSGDDKKMVRYLKRKLSTLGYYSGDESTYFDSATMDAVKAAQADLGMEETGIADNTFQQALYAL